MKRLSFITAAFSAVFLSLSSINVQAASLFQGISLEGHTGPFLVTKKHVNVRATPGNKGKKLSKLAKRDIVTVLGRAKGTQWLAVSRQGDELGFVYAPSLTPMIDASFTAPLFGTIDLSENQKPVCDFKVTHEGRDVEEEIIFVSSDYLASFDCKHKSDTFKFDAMMFMSEVPHDLGNKPIFQITLNLTEIATGYEEFLSATSLFDLMKQKVVMDAVSLKEFKEQDLRQSKDALNPKEAIEAALNLQLDSFNMRAWHTIAGKIPTPGEKEPQ
ncbi:SH3 domain-containing protein [Terasakiella sp. SH-1]|uniref:SH3 domain-containing protein n=1 Tax=Terasakiella sp. SH-1 TaxID=2560057 RepID=UPI001980FE6B|nr:SH3 domain-containing protein [Terasakiella sp. SH-1]